MTACVFSLSTVLQAPLATNSDECKGREIHSHKSNDDDSHETSALINHRGTLGFCSLLLIDLPPVFLVLLWTISYSSSILYCPSNSFKLNLHYVSARIKSATAAYIICFFPVCLPQAVIILHNSTVMHICAGLKALPSGSGFSFRDVSPFEVIFPLIHYGGSFFFLSSLISAHKVSGETCHGLMCSEAASGELCLCAADRGQWKEAVRFLRVFHVCVS